jgi:sugar phosphate isomerase/epimerase
MNRRTNLKLLGFTGLGIALSNGSVLYANNKSTQFFDKGIHIFSKHLQWLDYQEMAVTAKKIGFDGVDLTVRPGGHVLPEHVERDLPRAVEAIRKAGLKAELITTAITDPKEINTEKIIRIASKLGIKHYRMGWLKYSEEQPIIKQLEHYKTQLKELEQMNQLYKIHGAYQNHAGDSVGAPLWDIWYLIKDFDPEWLGCRFDIRHAMVEGLNSWKIDLRLLKHHIKSLDIKDFRYLQEGNKVEVENKPIGAGVVDFKNYFSMLEQLNINAPITLHAEYDLGGANKGATKLSLPPEQIISALSKDLNLLKQYMNIR